MPSGTVEFHRAFKQLSTIEKEVVTEVIIDWVVSGVKIDPNDPAAQSLIAKGILIKIPNGKFGMGLSALAAYDSYFGMLAKHRFAEIGRVHKNPLLAAIKH